MFFSIRGHKNVLCTHRNTLEFTKDKHLTKRGDCILGVEADFDFDQLKKIVKDYDKIKIIILAGSKKEEITASVNKEFNDKHEMVIRKSDFISERTLGIKADKAAVDINREIVKKLKNPEKRARVEIKGI